MPTPSCRFPLGTTAPWRLTATLQIAVVAGMVTGGLAGCKAAAPADGDRSVTEAVSGRVRATEGGTTAYPVITWRDQDMVFQGRCEPDDTTGEHDAAGPCRPESARLVKMMAAQSFVKAAAASFAGNPEGTRRELKALVAVKQREAGGQAGPGLSPELMTALERSPATPGDAPALAAVLAAVIALPVRDGARDQDFAAAPGLGRLLRHVFGLLLPAEFPPDSLKTACRGPAGAPMMIFATPHGLNPAAGDGGAVNPNAARDYCDRTLGLGLPLAYAGGDDTGEMCLNEATTAAVMDLLVGNTGFDTAGAGFAVPVGHHSPDAGGFVVVTAPLRLEDAGKRVCVDTEAQTPPDLKPATVCAWGLPSELKLAGHVPCGADPAVPAGEP